MLLAPTFLWIAAACDSGRATLPATYAGDSRHAIQVVVDSRFLENASSTASQAFDLRATRPVLPRSAARSGRLELLSASTSPTALDRARRAAGLSAHARRIAVDMETPCVIKPGVYAIVDESTGQLVGVLVVYPDCHLEIIPAS